MKISIISIVYNNAAFIEQCLKSCTYQTYPNIEHIIIDGGSSDGTIDIIEKNKSSKAKFISEPDNGLYDALNKGLSLATGDVIGILHSDDEFFNEDVINDVLDVFKTNPEVNLVYGKGQFVDRNNKKHVRRLYGSSKFSKWKLRFGWIPLHTTMFIRKDLLKEVGNYSLDYRIASDYDWSLRCFESPNVKPFYLNKVLVKMKLGGKSTTPSLQKMKSTEDLRIIREHKLLGYFTLFFKIFRKVPQFIFK